MEGQQNQTHFQHPNNRIQTPAKIGHDKREMMQTSKIKYRVKKKENDIDVARIKRNFKICEQLYANKFESLGEIDKFLESYKVSIGWLVKKQRI